MNNFIEVSVIIAVKNEEEYIRECLNSIISQTGVLFEVIIVDDSSTDNTFTILKQYSRNSSFIQVYKNPGLGKVSAFNFGFEKSRGKFICLFAGDDIMPLDSLSKRFNHVINYYMKGNPFVCGLFKLKIISKDTKCHGLVIPKAKNIGSYSGQSPLLSRELATNIFPVPDCLPNEDTWIYLFLNFISGINIINSDIICCEWRLHPGNSHNYNFPFDKFRQAIILRNSSYSLFFEKYRLNLELEKYFYLRNLVLANQKFINKDFLGIIFSGVYFRDKIRFLQSFNKFFYMIKSKFFIYLSGL